MGTLHCFRIHIERRNKERGPHPRCVIPANGDRPLDETPLRPLSMYFGGTNLALL